MSDVLPYIIYSPASTFAFRDVLVICMPTPWTQVLSNLVSPTRLSQFLPFPLFRVIVMPMQVNSVRAWVWPNFFIIN